MNPTLRIEIPIDPATIGTAQQKRVNHKTGRFFTPAKTAKAITAIAAVVRSAAIVQKWQSADFPVQHPQLGETPIERVAIRIGERVELEGAE